jgi:hypothetical protein
VDRADGAETRARRVHLVGAGPWRQAVDCYYNPDDDVDIEELGFDFPDRWDAGDLFVIVTTDSPSRAVIVVEETETGSETSRTHEHAYMGPFDFGLSGAAIESRLGTALPSSSGTLDPDLGERLITAIEAEESTPTPWREHDDRRCLAEAHLWVTPETWASCACCGKRSFDGVVLEPHSLTDDQERDFLGWGPITVCVTCHDQLHRPLAPSADDVLFGNRPLCPSCSAMRTYEVIWGMPAGPPGPGVLTAGCVITDPATFEYECGACEYAWTDDDDAYRPLADDEDAMARARIAPIPKGVYRPYSRKGEPGRVVIGQYVRRDLGPDTAWGPGTVHELFGRDGRTYFVDPATVRSAEAHTWESREW